MTLPHLPAWMEQWHNFAADAPGQVGSLGAIAFVATPSEVRMMIRPLVLLGDDVLNVIQKCWIIELMHAAILTTIASTAPNQASNGRLHWTFLARRSRALACKIAIKSANAM